MGQYLDVLKDDPLNQIQNKHNILTKGYEFWENKDIMSVFGLHHKLK